MVVAQVYGVCGFSRVPAPPLVEIWRSNPGIKGGNPDILKDREVTVSSSRVAYSFQGAPYDYRFPLLTVLSLGRTHDFYLLTNRQWKHWLHSHTCPFCRGVGPLGPSLSLPGHEERRQCCFWFVWREQSPCEMNCVDGLPELSWSSGWQSTKCESILQLQI